MSDRPCGDVHQILLVDVGGTNVRFAVLRDARVTPITRLAVRTYSSFCDALSDFLSTQPSAALIQNAVIAAAGIVIDHQCKLTNSSWIVDADELRRKLGFLHVKVVNDFEVLALALCQFSLRDLQQIGGHFGNPAAPRIVVGPGTGLGAAAFVPVKNGGLALHSEAGHATLAVGSTRESAVIDLLRQKFQHVSAERVLSGPGLENLYMALARLGGVTVPLRTAAEITRTALETNCAVCGEAVDMFCALLGEHAGNLALTFGASGGVYLSGDIVMYLRNRLSRSSFRARFDAKGRMLPYIERIPVYLILHDHPTFVGLRTLAKQLSKGAEYAGSPHVDA